MVKKYYDLLKKLIIEYNLKDEIKLFHLIKFEDIFIIDKKKDFSIYWDIIEKSLEQNLLEIIEMKEKEGETTKKDILNLIDFIKENLNIIGSEIKLLEHSIFNNIKKNFF